MIEKVKVTQAVADAVENFKKDSAFSTLMLLSIETNFINEKDFVLNEVPTETLAKVWFGDYEVEQIPEERLLNWLSDSKVHLLKLQNTKIAEEWNDMDKQEHYEEITHYTVEVSTLATVVNILKIGEVNT